MTSDYRAQQQADAFLRAQEERTRQIVRDELSRQTGVTPGGPYGSFTVRADGRIDWAGAGGGGASLVVSYWTASNLTIASSTNVRVNFANETYDPGGLVTTGASWVLTIPIGGSGKYQVVSKVRFAEEVSGWSAGVQAIMYLWRNGGVEELFDILDDPQNGTLNNTLSCDVVYDFDEEDEIAIAINQNSGSNKTILGARYECRIDVYKWT